MVLLAAGFGFYWVQAPIEESGPAQVAATLPAPAPVPAPVVVPVPVPVPVPIEGAGSGEPGQLIELPGAGLNKPAAAIEAKREAVWRALDKRHTGTGSDPGSGALRANPEAHLPRLDAAYIRESIVRDLVPIATECYESALEDDADLGGTVVLTFTIVGAEDVGGIVESAEIDERASTLVHAALHECMRESMMTVDFPAPEADGQVSVISPFEFEAAG